SRATHEPDLAGRGIEDGNELLHAVEPLRDALGSGGLAHPFHQEHVHRSARAVDQRQLYRRLPPRNAVLLHHYVPPPEIWRRPTLRAKASLSLAFSRAASGEITSFATRRSSAMSIVCIPCA